MGSATTRVAPVSVVLCDAAVETDTHPNIQLGERAEPRSVEQHSVGLQAPRDAQVRRHLGAQATNEPPQVLPTRQERLPAVEHHCDSRKRVSFDVGGEAPGDGIDGLVGHHRRLPAPRLVVR
jgi:hypothetical protein